MVVSEDARSVPDLAQWVKDPVLLGAGAGRRCSSNSTPGPGTFLCTGARKRGKKKRGDQERASPVLTVIQ